MTGDGQCTGTRKGRFRKRRANDVGLWRCVASCSAAWRVASSETEDPCCVGDQGCMRAHHGVPGGRQVVDNGDCCRTLSISIMTSWGGGDGSGNPVIQRRW